MINIRLHRDAGGQPGKSANLYGMSVALEDLPDDVAALKALLLAERAQSDRLRHLLAQLRRAHFGRKSEKIGTDQLNLDLEDIGTAIAAEEAKLEKTDAALKTLNTQKRKTRVFPTLFESLGIPKSSEH